MQSALLLHVRHSPFLPSTLDCISSQLCWESSVDDPDNSCIRAVSLSVSNNSHMELSDMQSKGRDSTAQLNKSGKFGLSSLYVGEGRY